MVDNFFRTFSGHTQVNATDLRALRFPSLSALRSLGHMQEMLLPRQDEIDRLIMDTISVMDGAA
jgi:adenine-specific DNA-methyltransferase